MLATGSRIVDSFIFTNNEPLPMRAINPKYRQLKAFVLAVETGSFRVAAERLFVTQPSFSALIKELEADLGTALFERDGRGSRLTAAGRSFHRDIAEPLEALEQAYARGRARGSPDQPALAVATLPSLASGVIGDKVANFRLKHPRLRITLLEQKHNEIAGSVLQRKVDFGIGSYLEKMQGLAFTPLFRDELVLLAPAGHPIQELEPAWTSLEGFDFVLLTGGPTEHALLASGSTPSNILKIEQAPTALSMVRRGMGVTVLPSTILPSCNTDGLVARAMRGDLAARQIGIIVREGDTLTAAAREFIGLLGDLASAVAGHGLS
jgi:DNA-binding transcriptional LysR family regulator